MTPPHAAALEAVREAAECMYDSSDFGGERCGVCSHCRFATHLPPP